MEIARETYRQALNFVYTDAVLDRQIASLRVDSIRRRYAIEYGVVLAPGQIGRDRPQPPRHEQ